MSSGSARSPARCSRRRCCWPTCSATSSTATASSRRSPTAGHRSSPSCRTATALVLNADDPLIADLGRGRGDVTLFRRRGRRSWRCPRCSTRRTRSTAAAAARRTSTTRSTSATWATTTARLRPAAPAPSVRAEQITLHGTARSDVHAGHAAGAARSIFLRCPASTTSTTRSAPRRSACRSGISLDVVVAGLEAATAAFGRAETVERRRHDAADPADQEPRRRERDPAHAGARAGRSSTCSRCSTTTSPTGATSPGSGTPTSSCSPRACAASPARERAPPSSPCGSSTPASPRICLEVDPGPAAGARSRAGRGGGRPCVRDADLHGAARAARRAVGPRPRVAILGGGRMSETVIWHDLECGALPRRTCRSGSSSPRRARARG